MKKQQAMKAVLASTLLLSSAPLAAEAAQTAVVSKANLAKAKAAQQKAIQLMTSVSALVQTKIAEKQLPDRVEVTKQYNAARAEEKTARGVIKKIANNDPLLLRELSNASAKHIKLVGNYLAAHATYDALQPLYKKLQEATKDGQPAAIAAIEKVLTSTTTTNRWLALDEPTRLFFNEQLAPMQQWIAKVKEELAKPVLQSFNIQVTLTAINFESTMTNGDGKEAIVRIYTGNGAVAAEVKGIVQNGKVAVSKSDLAPGTYRAVLEVAGVKSEEKSFVVIDPAAKVETFTTNSLRAFKLTFNKEINPATVNANTIKVLTGMNLALVPVDETPDEVKADQVGYIVAPDRKSISLVFGTTLAQATKAKVIVAGVQAMDGKPVERFEKETNVIDVEPPVVTSVRSLNKKQLEFQFSEPVTGTTTTPVVMPNIRIDGVVVVGTWSINPSTSTAVLEVMTPMKSGTVAVDVSDIADFAGYKSVLKSFTVNVLEDTTAPVVTKAEAINKGLVRLTFNEKVTNPGTVRINGLELVPQAVENSNGLQWDARANLDLSALVEVRVEYRGQRDIVDNTQLNWQTFTFRVADDVTVPQVTALVGEGNKLTLTFTKSMQPATGTVKLFNASNVEVASVNMATVTYRDAQSNVVDVPAAALNLADIDAGTYTLRLRDFRDFTVRGNALPELALPIIVKDTKRPMVVGNGYQVAAGALTGLDLGKDDTVTIYFSEPMEEASLRNLSNYLFGNMPAAAIFGVAVKSIAPDRKSVVLTYPNARLLTTPLSLYALRDDAGNMIMPATITPLSAANMNIAPVSARLTKKNELVMQFNSAIKSVGPSAIKVDRIVNGVPIIDTYAIAAVIDPTDATKVKFTLNRDISGDLSLYRVSDSLSQTIVNFYNDTFQTTAVDLIGSLPLQDGVAPEVLAVTKANLVNNKFNVKFNEPLAALPAGTVYDFRVRNVTDNSELLPGTDFTIERSATDLSEVTITILRTGLVNKKLSVELTNARFITDTAGNRGLEFQPIIVKMADGYTEALFSN